MGQDGLQLFVDAGVPLDERLVNNLVKEVLLEKAGASLFIRVLKRWPLWCSCFDGHFVLVEIEM